MRAQWLDVWEVGYKVKRIVVDGATGRAAGEEWGPVEAECVLGSKDGASAAARLREAMLDVRFEGNEGPELRGRPMYTDFRLVSLTHKARAALFPGVLRPEKGGGQ